MGAKARAGRGRTAIVLGTRPEIIKMSPVIRAFQRAHIDFYVLHTGQHYSFNMDRVFFENLGLDPPLHNLGVGSGTHGEETGKMIIGIEKILLGGGTSGVLVEGDTNTVLAGALAASKLGIRIGHVEAGLRSGDRRMPEELNRIVADHVADILFAPTRNAEQNLLREGISSSKIVVTGNTIVDAVMENTRILPRGDLWKSLSVASKGYLLATVHRQENVDDPTRLRNIIRGLELTSKETGMPVVFPAHPRSAKAVERQRVKVNPRYLKVVPPFDYLHFLQLEKGAGLVLTDSGGVQEEACILGVPCVTLRDNTERPETIDVGANVLAGTEPSNIAGKAVLMLAKKGRWKNPFGDGNAAERIARAWTAA